MLCCYVMARERERERGFICIYTDLYNYFLDFCLCARHFLSILASYRKIEEINFY